MQNRYFRAGVGTVIYNSNNELAFFRRAQYPAGIWQFQQGGIDTNESVTTTLWRELKEEVGLTEDAVSLVTELPHWTVYQDLQTAQDDSAPRLGQAHCWFYLRLKEDESIDLSNATDNEFDEWKWVSFSEAISLTNDHKKHVYETLHVFFQNHLAT